MEMQTIAKKRGLILISLLLLAACIFLLLFTAFRGLAFPDEGYIVNTGQRILNGQVLYRDFDFVYTPLTAFATSLSFLALGSSILSERILALLFSLATIFTLIRLGKLLTTHHLFYLLPAITYIAWGPTHINFIWPGMWAIDFAIIAFCLLFEAVTTNKPKLFYLSGIFISFIILTKQNYAVAALLTLFFLIAELKPLRNRLMLTYLFLGITIPISLFLIYAAVTDSTWAFLNNSYVNVIQEILLKGSINTPLLVGSTPEVVLGKILFYASPLLLSLLAGVIVWKKERTKLILVSFVAIFYLFGFRPVSDYVHLTPLLSLSGIPLLILLTSLRGGTTKPGTLRYLAKQSHSHVILNLIQNFSKRLPRSLSLTRNDKIIFILLTSCFILPTTIGLWSSLFFGYYRWSPPLISQNTYINNPRVKIWTDNQTQNNIQTVTNLLNKYSKPKEEIFLNYYAPIVYFITDRRNPTRYDYTGLSVEYQNDLIQILDSKKVLTIVTFYLNENDTSVVGEFIRDKYIINKKSAGYVIWRRK